MLATDWTKGVPAIMGDEENVTISVRYNRLYEEVEITNGEGVGIGMTLKDAKEFVKQLSDTISEAERE